MGRRGTLCLVGPHQLAVPAPGVLDGALLRREVDVGDPKTTVVAEGPLEVVEQRPGEVAAHVRSGVDRVGHRADHVLQAGTAAGVREVIAVIVDADANGSLTLHRRRGFVEAGRLERVGFKHGRWLDTVLLQKSLA